MKEVWNPIVDVGYYVSNFGRVLSRKRKKPRIISQQISNSGYVRVHLCVNGKGVNYSVHRLVAEAFVEKEEGCDFVNHKDENKLNNNFQNLEWCTSEYNNNYGATNYRQARTKGKPIYQVSKNGVIVDKFFAISEASRQTGFALGGISECANGKRHEFRGYRWRFAEKEAMLNAR